MRNRTIGLLAGAVLAFCAVVGCGADDGGNRTETTTDEATTTTLEGCVETERGCIDPESIAPGECVSTTPESEDCVNYRPIPDEMGDDPAADPPP